MRARKHAYGYAYFAMKGAAPGADVVANAAARIVDRACKRRYVTARRNGEGGPHESESTDQTTPIGWPSSWLEEQGVHNEFITVVIEHACSEIEGGVLEAFSACEPSWRDHLGDEERGIRCH